jgi:hypothetical protein
VVAVEEDWVLTVKEPDPNTQSPQVSCIIAPNDDGVFAAFNLNHRAYPQYAPGGLHLQLWQGEQTLQSAEFPVSSLMSTQDESVAWTTRMELKGGQLQIEVVNGESATWGNFGGTGTLKVVKSSALCDLNDYRSGASKSNSGIGYAGNRVASLKLKAVRKVLRGGDVVEDTNPLYVYPHE